MGALDDVVRKNRLRADDQAERGAKVVPVTIATVNPLTVYVQGSVTAVPATWMDGQSGSVGATGYALWWPGQGLAPIVFMVRTQALMPYLKMTKNGNSNVTANTRTVVGGWTVNKSQGFASVSGSSFTAAIPGLYFVSGAFEYGAAASGRRLILINAAGTDTMRSEQTAAVQVVSQVSDEVWVDAGQTVEIQAFVTGATVPVISGESYITVSYRGNMGAP